MPELIQRPALELSPELIETLLPLVEERQQLATQRSKAEKRINELSATLKAVLSAAGAVEGDTVTIGKHRLNLAPNTRTEISKEILLNLGLTIDQIAEATVTKTFEPKLDVKENK
jgi:hypothetical protein